MTRQEIKAALDEYNAMYGTDVELSDILEEIESVSDDEYIETVNERLAMGDSFDSATQYPMR